jgi:hypothetical protein
VNARILVIGLIAISVLTVAASIYFQSAVVPFEKAYLTAPSPNGRYKAVRLSVTRKTPPA